jgi:hypothetical protein
MKQLKDWLFADDEKVFQILTEIKLKRGHNKIAKII